jgi:hypothetical protein
MTYIGMPSPIYWKIVNLIVGFPIWRRPSIFMNCCDVRTSYFFTVRSLDVTNLTPLPLLISCKLSFSISFKNVFPAYFGIEIYQNLYMVFMEFIKHTFQFLVEAVLRIISVIFCWSMNIQNNNDTCEILALCMISCHKQT